jgi:AcrR family transcriptional regulator
MPTAPPAPPSPQPPALRVRYACSEQRGTPAKSTVNAIWRITAACASVTPLISRRPYKKVAREQSEQRTRDALLDAADEEFDEGRWRRSSLDAVAAKAGVTKQTLLRHFGSKDGLLLQTLARGAAQVLDQRFSAPVGDVAGAVENLLDHYEAFGRRGLRIGTWQEGPAALVKLERVARQVHYDWVDHAFAPWLQPLAGDVRVRRRAALIALCDVHVWWLLSHDLGLARSAVQATLTDMIERLLAESDDSSSPSRRKTIR